ncbi:helicase [candidate division WOR-3 bacterium]|uniref:Helicase n=1 Tax=candidate division WOR-3 bacterium TaxID=2052148 RepID=A0A938BUF6_UNCW3|nr:helicase [candidate division WOR-3 bacterium]
MPAHDIIDNRRVKLVDQINRILDTTEAARFAVGYFFVSGLEGIAEKLGRVKELRLLIGNTTNRETLEQLAEGRRRLELVRDAVEAEAYRSAGAARKAAVDTGAEVRTALELMDQTDEAEELVQSLADMIEQKRVKVKVYTRGRLHAKAYIFDYGQVFNAKGKEVERQEKGIAVVGSSNLTLAGVANNTELNVLVQGNANHAELVRWFDELWKEADDFDETLMQEIRQSWAAGLVRPYDIYLKTLYELVRDRLTGEDAQEVLWDDEITSKLANFQKAAVTQAVQMLRRYGGAFVADVVGLGKSYVGAAIIRHFERTDHVKPIIICPAALVDMWERYNAVYSLNAVVVSLGLLLEGDSGLAEVLLKDERYRDRDFVLIDESHNLRHSDTQRYAVVQQFLSTGDRYCCFLTATPRNKSAWDVYYQIKLFHQDDKTDLPIDPPNLNQYFKLIDKGERKLPELLFHLQVRRLRRHVLRWYGFAGDTQEPLAKMSDDEVRPYLDGPKRAYILVGERHQFFPKRELETVEYSIDDTYQGLYQQIRGFLGKGKHGCQTEIVKDELTYARYGLWHYVKPEMRKKAPYDDLQHAGANLRGLVRILLFKRFESSVYAFRETVKRLVRMQERFLDALDAGFVPAGEGAEAILYEPSAEEEQDLLEALRNVSGKYALKDFDAETLKQHIEHDVRLLKRILKLVEPVTPDKDAKLVTLKRRLAKKPLAGTKVLLFTQYADTARYLFDNLNPGGKREDIEVIYSGDKSKEKVVGRFAPKANPEYQFQRGESQISLLVATDVLAEGLNLQDCNCIINYDLHWNPVRLIQRFGRIDRIGSEHDVVHAYNFLPETGLDRQLGLKSILHSRIQEIHDTIGEDSAILDQTEHLNVQAMYAIYQASADQLSMFDPAGEEPMDLNEAEEMLRRMQREDPAEFSRVAALRRGIRSSLAAITKGTYVMCEAGEFRQLYLMDTEGGVISRDLPRVLSAIRCERTTNPAPRPEGLNAQVMHVARLFAEEVKQREAEKRYSVSLSHAQKYVQREIRVMFNATEDEDAKARLNLLEQAFCAGSLTSALRRELNKLRRNGVAGAHLEHSLRELYEQHGLGRRDRSEVPKMPIQTIPRVVCSEGLV